MQTIYKEILLNINGNVKKGQVTLFIAVSMTVFILYIGLYTINKNINEQRALIDATNSMGSFYAADMGTERFLLELKKRIDNGDYVSIQDTIDASSIGVVNLDATDGRSYGVSQPVPNQVKSIGSYKNTNRAIELSYNP